MLGNMFAYIDNRPPTLVNTRTICLLGVFVLLAFLVSPKSPLSRKHQDRFVCWFPLGIFVYWVLFQWMLISLNPHVHYYLSHRGVPQWRVNSGICYGFGAAFSFRMLRIQSGLARAVGVFWLLLYALLVLAFGALPPPTMET